MRARKLSALLDKAKKKTVHGLTSSLRIVQRRKQQQRIKPRRGADRLRVESNDEGLTISAFTSAELPRELALLVHGCVVGRVPVTEICADSDGLRGVEALVPYELILSLQNPETGQELGASEPAGEADDSVGEEAAGASADNSTVVRLAWIVQAEPPADIDAADPESECEPLDWRPAGCVGAVREGMLVRAKDLEDVSFDDEWLRLVGRAAETDLSGLDSSAAVEIGGVRLAPFVTSRGDIAIRVGGEQLLHAAIYAHEVDIQPWGFNLSGRIFTAAGDVSGAELIVKPRQGETSWAVPLTLRLDEAWTARDFGRRHFRYVASVAFPEDMWSSFSGRDSYDAWVHFPNAATDRPLRRVNKVPFATRVTAHEGVLRGENGILAIIPYFTFKAKALSFIIEPFGREQAPYVLNPSAHASKTRPVASAGADGHSMVLAEPNQDVWIIGEQPHRAQDNGLAFYRWVRREHPEIAAFYVIADDSPDLEKLRGDDHVLLHGSREHFALSLRADRFIGSHHPDYLFPARTPDFVRELRGTRIFLQHGVMGTKWMTPTYGKQASGFNVDRFFVSSALEKRMIVEDFGYDPDEVVITGLPRFDSLLDGQKPVSPRQVFIMPTWRDWLSTDDRVADSEYLAAWSELLSSERFRTIAAEHNLSVVLNLHTNMRRFAHLFDDLPVRLIEPGTAEIQQLMKDSAVMITDYSSVGFDFSFQNRPVIYFQFDRDRFLGKWGSHLDLDEQLPGAVEVCPERVLDALQELAEADFRQPAEFARRASAFHDHGDQRNNDRVFAAIVGAPAQTAVSNSGEWSGFAAAAKRRFRRSRRYYPLMKAYYRVLSRLPGPRETLVFESGRGKQYSDSPRYIYEELLRRGDTRPKVWVYSGPKKFDDPNTTIVKRLSPQYYTALARAKMWTMNQSAPSYLVRPKATRFVQTWHGTPLKRMQFDMVDVNAQDSGYLERAQAGVRQWTHLLSPSPYATEAFRSAFRYTGPIVEQGYPRNDPLVRDDAPKIRAQVRKSLGIDDAAQAVLYAPTFRDDQAKGKSRFEFTLPFDLERFADETPEDTVLLVRLHVLVADKVEIPEYLAHRVIDVSRYPEIQELYLASDALVTDYSSVFFDAALLRRPIVFYAYDLENYRDNLRGFYLDYDTDLPGPIVTEEADLWRTVAEGLADGIDEERRSEFLRRFAPMDDGHAAARVVDELY